MEFQKHMRPPAPKPWGPREGLWGTPISLWVFSPHAQSLYHRVQLTHLTDGKKPQCRGTQCQPCPHSLWPVCPIRGWTEMAPQSSPLLLAPLRGPPSTLTRNGSLGQAYYYPLPPPVAKKNPCPRPFLLGPHGR